MTLKKIKYIQVFTGLVLKAFIAALLFLYSAQQFRTKVSKT